MVMASASLTVAGVQAAPVFAADGGGGGGAPTATVSAVAETVVFPGASGDVADDVAIWRNPAQPDKSLILADNKADEGGVAVHRLDGSLAHYERTGSIGNIDLRTVGVGGQNVVLVGANDRSADTLRFWTLDTEKGTLTGTEARSLKTVTSNYGFCLGHDSARTHTYAFTSSESGTMEQYELWVNSGRIDAVKLRSFAVGSLTEGCAVDDATGSLYVGEEDVGIWRYDVDPTTGDRRTAIDKVGGRLTADVEGLSTVRGADGKGVLIASSQGDSTFSMYGLDDDRSFVGRFRVAGAGDVDDVTETDGLAAFPGSFGPSYPNGLLVVHDASNQKPGGGGEEPNSNLKFVRLDQVVKLSPSS